jgi:hypothetical protein
MSVKVFPVGDVLKVVLPTYAVPGKPLGRHVHHDPRSRAFPAERVGRVANVKHGASHLPLWQSDRHLCSTAHSLCAAVNCAPVASPVGLDESDAVTIYDVATAIESFTIDGRDVPGSSGLMACKAARRLGIIHSYQHAFGLEHALAALMLRPVMTGFTWYSSFDTPDPETGLVEMADDAQVRGGHEVVADEIDLERQRVWFWNSWGPDYGVNGRFCMSFETWARLLADHGDVTVPVV